MKYLKLFIFGLFFLLGCNHEIKQNKNDKENTLKSGYWKGSLLVQNQPIPFMFYIDSNQRIAVYNDKKLLKMNAIENVKDSSKVAFNAFPNYFKFKIKSNKDFAGYFVNPDHKEPRIQLKAKYISDKPFQLLRGSNKMDLISGKWEVKFISNTDHPYFAIGQFYNEKNTIKGTFLKNSGDEGFLSGTFINDTLKLYSFNGSSASIFIANLKNDTLKGMYLSGNSGKTHWMAFKNENFQLEDKNAITYLVDDSLFFNFKTITGETFTYPNDQLKNKVIIFQIMGTWCPNCLDETLFFKELYEKYHKSGLEIIGIAYEKPTNFDKQVQRVQRFIKNEQLSYPILIGGSLSNNKVEKDFSMLNKIAAFPTAIYINRKGEVAKIYTGFSGPGTGNIYEKYKRETITFIENLLNQ